jgi:hypothetical protein
MDVLAIWGLSQVFQVKLYRVLSVFQDNYSKMSTDEMNIDMILAAVKTFESTDLFKLLKAAVSEAEKKSKQTKATAKATPAKKAGSMPKGAIPPQLKKPRAWVEFTLKHALENGWEPFTILQKKKDKETNTVIEEQIEMPGSTLHEGAYVFEDSITEKTPNGRQLIHKEAMSLSKQRKENNHATYAEFEANYVEEASEDEKSTTSSTASKIVVKKTAAEKEAEKEAKKAEKESEKAAKKAEKEAEKEAKKAAKEAEKEAKKAEKEAEKTAKKAEKETTKKSATKAPVPAKAVKKADAPAPAPAAAVAAPKKKPAAPKAEEVPNDGMVHPWTHNGKKYLRNFEGETWTIGADGGIGKWAGLYKSDTNTIDESATEPVFEDEE